ncbi:MAG: DUF4338 domain-containing protein [Bryobacterales bacterium]|nr:DUF4338 domain-containing protein [Bryobacterales bacterium]
MRTGNGSPFPRGEATTAPRQEFETTPGPQQPTAASDPPLPGLPPPSRIRARALLLIALRQELTVAARGTGMYTAITISATIVSSGVHLRYLVHPAHGCPLARLGFGAPARKTAPRDRYVGWSQAARERKLASPMLACVEGQIPEDWQQRHRTGL